MSLAAVPHVLVIDDDHAVLGMVCDALEHHGMTVHSFSEGKAAMKLLEDPLGPPLDLVISDINMEGMDGFDVIHRVKSIHPSLPVVLMTGQASLDYAIRAMRMGAANLFQKPVILRELINNVYRLVGLHRELRLAEAGLKGLVRETRHFSFRSDRMDVSSTVMHLTDRLVPMGFASSSNVDVIAMAFHEALVNALEHGNLEMDSSLKGDLFAAQDAYSILRNERLSDPGFAARAIEVQMDTSMDRYEVVIKDEGKGFNTKIISRISEDTLAAQCGRGLALIHMVMDEVSHNSKGNEIRMVLFKK